MHSGIFSCILRNLYTQPLFSVVICIVVCSLSIKCYRLRTALLCELSHLTYKSPYWVHPEVHYTVPLAPLCNDPTCCFDDHHTFTLTLSSSDQHYHRSRWCRYRFWRGVRRWGLHSRSAKVLSCELLPTWLNPLQLIFKLVSYIHLMCGGFSKTGAK